MCTHLVYWTGTECHLGFLMCPLHFRDWCSAFSSDVQSLSRSLLPYHSDRVVFFHLWAAFQASGDGFEEGGPQDEMKKSFFLQPEVKNLGHIISNKGVTTDPAKIEAVGSWQQAAHYSWPEVLPWVCKFLLLLQAVGAPSPTHWTQKQRPGQNISVRGTEEHQ